MFKVFHEPVDTYMRGNDQCYAFKSLPFTVVEQILNNYDITIQWEFENTGEIFELYQLTGLIKTILDQNEINMYTMNLEMSYFPYYFMQNVAGPEMANLLFECNINNISIFDMEIKEYLTKDFDSVSSIIPVAEIERTLDISKSSVLCFPNQKAFDRYYDELDLDAFMTMKVKKDPDTQETIGYEIDDDLSNTTEIEGLNILVMDQFCYGPRKFALTSEALRKANKLSLYASHVLLKPHQITQIQEAGYDEIYSPKGLYAKRKVNENGQNSNKNAPEGIETLHI